MLWARTQGGLVMMMSNPSRSKAAPNEDSKQKVRELERSFWRSSRAWATADFSCSRVVRRVCWALVSLMGWPKRSCEFWRFLMGCRRFSMELVRAASISVFRRVCAMVTWR